MPRKSIPSTTLVQAVRRYFGLEQQELAAYLGIGRAMVGHLEAGRRSMSATVLLRLNPLARHLPPTPPLAPPTDALPPSAPPPETGQLAQRLYYCNYQAARRRRKLAALHQQAGYAQRWADARPGILADVPAVPPLRTLADADAPAMREWWHNNQQRKWAEERAAALTPTDVAGYHLLRLQAEALETEAAALAALLGTAAG